VTAGSIKPLLDDMVLLLTFGIRSRIGESHSGRPCREERVERLSLLGPQPGQVRPAIFARTFTSIIDYKQAASTAFKDYCKTESAKDVIPDVILKTVHQ
jgi:hypothetical protein